MKSSTDRAVRILFTTLTLVIGFAAVIVSPILLRAVSELMGEQNWETLSFIGQTYGAVAALITAFSIAGIVVSLLLQVRALSVQMEHGARNNLIDLVSLGIAHPELIKGGPFGPEQPSLPMLYSGLWFSHFAGLYSLGFMSEAEVRSELEILLRSSTDARARWQSSRLAYKASLGTGLKRKYFDI